MDWQTPVSLVIVAAAFGWLIWRSIKKRRKGGCGGSCGCAPPVEKGPKRPS